MSRFVMALDQGTTSSRAILFDRDGALVAVDQHEFTQHFPKPGWVEHDPAEIWESQLRAARGALAKAGARGADVAAHRHHQPARDDRGLGSRAAGEPIHRAIVWQSRQTAPICDALRARGLADEVRARTGPRDRRLLLGHQDPLHPRRGPGRAAARGARRARLRHRRQLAAPQADARARARDRVLERLAHAALQHPHARLGRAAARRAAHPARDAARGARLERRLRQLPTREWFGAEIPIAGIAGDQQAALFGQGCTAAGPRQEHLRHRLLPADEHGRRARRARRAGSSPRSPGGSAAAWSTRSRAACSWRARRCSGCATGSGSIERAAETEAAARSVAGHRRRLPGAGLRRPRRALLGRARARRAGRPHARHHARARGRAPRSRRSPTRRATWSSVMRQDSGLALETLRVDGGACENDFLMQFQADVLGAPVQRPAHARGDGLGRGAARRARRRLLDATPRELDAATAGGRALRAAHAARRGATRSTRAGSARSSARAAGRRREAAAPARDRAPRRLGRPAGEHAAGLRARGRAARRHDRDRPAPHARRRRS